MKIVLENTGKRFNKQWLFKDLSYTFESNKSYALIGHNGSGKSTLLQIIYNFTPLSKGNISYSLNQQILSEESVQTMISFTAPYLELPEEFTIQEVLNFHFKLTRLQHKYDLSQVLIDTNLSKHLHKPVKVLSSGMKQRLKLILAICSDTPLLLLDEPCSNLDDQGISWYKKLMLNEVNSRTIIVASNQSYEFEFCTSHLQISNYHPAH